MTALLPEQKERQKAARARAGRIRLGITDYINTLGWIAQARAEEDHLTLGYKSWAEYVDGEYGDARIQLPPEMRRKAVDELRLAGATQREIGHTLGVSHTQVRRDLAGTYVPPDGTEDHRGDTPGDPNPDPMGTGPVSDAAAGPFPPPAAAPDHPAAHVAPEPGDEAARSSAAAEGAGRTSDPAPAPSGPPCEACGEVIDHDAWADGCMRCYDCDPHGEHIADGDGCHICDTAPTCPTCGQRMPT